MADNTNIIHWRCKSVETMIKLGIECRATCGLCRTIMEVDLEALKILRGGRFCLIDRRPKCKVFECEGKVVFQIRHGTIWRPLLLNEF